MKKIAFVSEMAFMEPNLSIVKRLNTKYDLYYITDCRQDIPNKFEIKQLNKKIDIASNYREMEKFSSFLCLSKTYLIHSYSNKMIFNAIRKAFDTFFLIRKIKPSIIVTDTTAPITLLIFLFFWKKIILLIHDPFPHSGYNKKWIIIFRNIVFKIIKNKVLFNNKQYQEFIEAYHLNHRDVFCSHLSTFEFMNLYAPIQQNKNRNKFKILFWGIISQYKGLEYLCEAFKKINNKNMELTVAGSGKLYFDITPYTSMENFKFIHKFLSNEEIAELLHNTDIVVCPYTDATQSGIIMTAFAYNKPVIATKVGGIPEIINDKTGILIEPKNTIQLIEAINNLYDNPQKVEKIENYLKYTYNTTQNGWDHAVSIIQEAIEKQHKENS